MHVQANKWKNEITAAFAHYQDLLPDLILMFNYGHFLRSGTDKGHSSGYDLT